jgi:hypothetical protein
MDGFVAGTRIDTPLGERAVEDLRPGDAVLTADGGLARVAWTADVPLPAGDPRHDADALVLVRAGAFDGTLPRRDLLAAPDQAFQFDGADGPLVVTLRQIINLRSISRPGGDAPVTYRRIALHGAACLRAEGVVAIAHGACDPRLAPTTGGVALAHLTMAIDHRADSWVPPLRGGIDPDIHLIVEGWVIDRVDPGHPVELDLFNNGAFHGRFVADLPRTDILRAFGYLHRGFSFPLPPATGQVQTIDLRRARDGLDFVSHIVVRNGGFQTPVAADDAAMRSALAAGLLRRIDRLRAHPIA